MYFFVFAQIWGVLFCLKKTLTFFYCLEFFAIGVAWFELMRACLVIHLINITAKVSRAFWKFTCTCIHMKFRNFPALVFTCNLGIFLHLYSHEIYSRKAREIQNLTIISDTQKITEQNSTQSGNPVGNQKPINKNTKNSQYP